MTIRRRINVPAEISEGRRQATGQTSGTASAGPAGFEYESVLADLASALDDALRGVETPAKPRSGGVRLMYQTKADGRVRPSHAALHGTLWDADDPERPTPPLDFGCRCTMVPVATNKQAGKRTGLPVVVDAPRPGADAMQQFWDETGVTPQQTLGETVGRLVEDGKVDAAAVLRDDLTAVTATTARGIAQAGGSSRAARAVLVAEARLAGFGLSVQQSRSVLVAARAIRAAHATDLAAIESALSQDLPGFLRARTASATAKRVASAAKILLRYAGGAL